MKASLILGVLLAVTLCGLTTAQYNVAQGSTTVEEVGKVEPEPAYTIHTVGTVGDWKVVSVKSLDG